MKNIWKNVLGVALIAAISSGAAIGTSTYLMNKNQRPAELASGVENTFKQPYRLTNYGTVAAENIDFTTACRRTPTCSSTAARAVRSATTPATRAAVPSLKSSCSTGAFAAWLQKAQSTMRF